MIFIPNKPLEDYRQSNDALIEKYNELYNNSKNIIQYKG